VKEDDFGASEVTVKVWIMVMFVCQEVDSSWSSSMPVLFQGARMCVCMAMWGIHVSQDELVLIL